MGFIKGETIELLVKKENGTDAFGIPAWTEEWVRVRNVLISPMSAQDAAEIMKLDGKVITYELSIPYDDDHVWENTEVRFWGKTFGTVGIARAIHNFMVPLDWNKKIGVELHE